MNLYTILPLLLARLFSILQASTLRERYFIALDRIEVLETALDDIDRISASRADQSERHRLIQGIVRNSRSLK